MMYSRLVSDQRPADESKKQKMKVILILEPRQDVIHMDDVPREVILKVGRSTRQTINLSRIAFTYLSVRVPSNVNFDRI